MERPSESLEPARKALNTPAEDIPLVEFKIDPSKVDMKYLEEMERLKAQDVKKVVSGEPSEVLDVEIRLREGLARKGDAFKLNGIDTYIPQLSFIDIQRATREGIKMFDKTEIGKRVLYENRRAMDKAELISMSTFEERQVLRDMSDVEDLWLAFFALRDAKYPKITGDFKKDRLVIEYLPRAEIEEYIEKVRRFNGMETSNSESPSVEDDVKSFRDDAVGRGIPGGDGKDKV